MKKVIAFLTTIIFLVSNSNVQASLFQSPNPYSFGPEGRTVADLRDFAKPKQITNILANKPVVATKADGTRVFYTSDGKMSLSIGVNGEMSFSLGGQSKTYDKNGKLTGVFTTKQGNIQEVKNEWNEITGYKQLDGNGRTIIAYDENMNKIATYDYGKFGKTLVSSTNELTKEKTVYDKFERAMATYSDDGYIMTTYQYDDVTYDIDTSGLEDGIIGGDSNINGVEKENLILNARKTLKTTKTTNEIKHGTLLTTKSYNNQVLPTDDETASVAINIFSHDTTYYNDKGATLYVNNNDGITTTIYEYKQDEYGNTVLDYTMDILTKNKTYYENGRQSRVVNDMGATVAKYYWMGSKLYASSQINDGTVTSITTYSFGKTQVTAFGNVGYDGDGNVYVVLGDDGEIKQEYYYKINSEGKKVLDYINNKDNDTTTYCDYNGQAIKTVNYKGEIITDYGWNKNNLVYSFDRVTGITTWYDPSGNAIYDTKNNTIQSKNIYSDGQLIGVWTLYQGRKAETNKKEYGNTGKESEKETNSITLKDTDTYTLTVYVNEKQRFSISDYEQEPTVDEVRKWIKMYTTGEITTFNI